MHRIVVLGAGYTGMTAAVSLVARTKQRDDTKITVVNASERFTERLRLHQLASGQELAELTIAELLPEVELVRGWVTAVDVDARTVRVDDERVVEYDTLVYALGGVADTAAVPGADDHAYTLDNADSAEVLARRLSTLATGTVAVCGSGLTGVEAAAEIAERHPHLEVVLLGREAARGCHGAEGRGVPAGRAGPARGTGAHGVEIIKVLPDAVRAGRRGNGRGRRGAVDRAASGCRCWRGASRPTSGGGSSPTPRCGRCRTRTVYAVGDAAAVRQGYGLLHGTCQSGMPTGVHAAASIARELHGKEPKPFRFGYYHTPVSLGRHDAVVQFTQPDDSPRKIALTGRRAVWYKETVTASPWPTFRRIGKFPVMGAIWRRGGRYTR